jgi:hypothetical protein
VLGAVRFDLPQIAPAESEWDDASLPKWNTLQVRPEWTIIDGLGAVGINLTE